VAVGQVAFGGGEIGLLDELLDPRSCAPSPALRM
jgi:hypothetical protein